MNLRNIFLTSLIVILFSACSTSYYIASDYEKGTTFESYKTYKVYNHKDGFPLGANPINKQRIDRAIHNEMDALGYKTSDDPDLLVSWFVMVKNVKSVDVYHDYYRGWGYDRHVSVYEYKEGTLVIDMIDREKQQVVWHGKTSERVYEGMPNVDKKINTAIRAMAKQYVKDAKLDKEYAAN